MHFPQLGERSRAAPSVFLIVVFLLSLPAVTVRFYASDEIEYFAYLRSMWFDGDLSFDNEYPLFLRSRDRAGMAFQGDLSRRRNRNRVAAQFCACRLGDFVVAVLHPDRCRCSSGAQRRSPGAGRRVSNSYIASIVYASALYGFLAIALSAYAASRVVGSIGAAGAAALSVWLGTPILFYMYLAPGFSHACSAFAVSAFVVVWLHVRRDWSVPGVVALGAAAALMGMVREQDSSSPSARPSTSSISMGRGCEAAHGSAAGGWPCGLPPALPPFALCFLPQVLTYMALFGRAAPSPTVQNKMTWTSPHTWHVLASPANGLLFWTPLALPALIGLMWLAVRRKPLEAAAGMASTRAPEYRVDLSRNGDDANLCGRSTRHVGRRGIVRPAPARGADGVPRPGTRPRFFAASCAIAGRAMVPTAVHRARRMVESWSDGAVRCRVHEPPAPGARAQCVPIIL